MRRRARCAVSRPALPQSGGLPEPITIRDLGAPLLPVAWERINEVWYSYVKGLNPAAYFGIFDVVRLDTVWLDKS